MDKSEKKARLNRPWVSQWQSQGWHSGGLPGSQQALTWDVGEGEQHRIVDVLVICLLSFSFHLQKQITEKHIIRYMQGLKKKLKEVGEEAV